MSRSVLTMVVSAALALPASSLVAQDAAGKYEPVLGVWESTMETPRGSFTQEFVFKLDSDKLVGTVTSQMGASDLSNVSFEDGVLKFDVLREFNGRSFSSSYTATIEGGMMKGTSSSQRGEREFTATRVET